MSPDPQPSPAIRLPAMLTGLGLCALIAVGLPYGEFVIKGTRLGLSSSTPAAFFLLFCLLALVQPLLGLVRRHWAFNRAELLLITAMMMLATAIPSRGFTGAALPAISSVLYYATPENNWAELLVPHIPTWLVVQDEVAIKQFYEGLPRGESIPWGAWVEPLFWWLLFMAAFYLVLICAMVIMRRQWMDHERLLYPLVQVPLGMIEDGPRPARIKPFLRNPIMWAGFAVPAILNTINSFSHYYEFAPRVDLNLPLALGHDAVVLRIRLNYLMMGLAYFINTGISGSLWFFYVLAKAQEWACSTLGIFTTEQLDAYSHAGPTTGMLSHQSMGAMIALVVLGLWTARGHLKAVWQQAKAGGSAAGELLSYRTAVVGLAVGLVVMGLWLWQTGLPWWAVVLFLGAAFAIFFALTRVIVEAGLSSAVEGTVGRGLCGLGRRLVGAGGDGDDGAGLYPRLGRRPAGLYDGPLRQQHPHVARPQDRSAARPSDANGGAGHWPFGLDLRDLELGLPVRGAQPAPPVFLRAFRLGAVSLCRPLHRDADRTLLAGVALERSGGRGHGALAVGAPPFVVVAPAPHRLRGQRHLDPRQHLVQHLSRLAD